MQITNITKHPRKELIAALCADALFIRGTNGGVMRFYDGVINEVKMRHYDETFEEFVERNNFVPLYEGDKINIEF